MKKILLSLLLSASLLSGCGAKGSGSSLPAGTNQPGENASNTAQMEEPNQPEEPNQTTEPGKPENPKQAEKADLSGIYTDKQGTSDVYSELELALQADGTYAAKIGVYRVTELEGTAVWEGDTLRFTSEDPHVLADISINDGKAGVTIIADTIGILIEDVYSFPDGAPDETEQG